MRNDQKSALDVFFQFLGEYWYIVFLYVILSLVYILETYLTKYLGNLIGKENRVSSFRRIVQILSISVLFRGSLYVLDSYFLPFFEKNIRLNLMERDIHDINIDVGVSLKDAMTLPESMTQLFEIIRYTLIPSFFTSISIIVLVFKIVPKIGIYSIVVFVLVLFFCIFQVFGQNKYFSPYEIHSGDIISKNHADVIKNRGSVLQYNQVKNELLLNQNLNVNYNTQYRGRFLYTYLFKIFIIATSFLLLLGGTIIAYKKFNQNEITTSQMSTITLLLLRYVEVNGRYIISIGQFSHIWKLLKIKTCYYNRSFGFFGYRGFPYESSFNERVGRITFSDVIIQKETFLLKINHLIISDPLFCIYGLSGSGKTSLINCLMKNNVDYTGSIRICNRELHDIQFSDINNIIAFLPQRPTLFNRTLLENILYNNKEKNRQDVQDLMIQMNITNLNKDDLDRKVNLEGDNFSGGQIQIACILRAILRKKQLVILDEPTSALDEENKHHVLKTIKSLSLFSKVIVVSHDPDIISIAGQVLHLNKGEVVNS